MSKQLTLFGTCARSTKSYIIYRDPKGDYECFIERYCLRARRERGHIANQKIVAEAQSKWKNIYKGNHAKLEEFFVLQENEKEFARYSSMTYIIKHYMFIYLLSFVETPRKFIIAELSIRKLGSSSVLIIRLFEFTRLNKYSGTPLIWSPTGRNNMAVLTG